MNNISRAIYGPSEIKETKKNSRIGVLIVSAMVAVAVLMSLYSAYSLFVKA